MTLTGGEERGQGGDVLPIIRFGSETNTVGDSDWITQLNVSPVPTNAEAWVNLNVQEAGQVRITVLDARGAEVAIVHDGQLAAGEHRIMLNASQWAAGTYFVKGIGEHGIFRTPLIVQ